MLQLDTPIGFIKGVGPKRAEWLGEELGVQTLEDLLTNLPFRYEDRSQFYAITEIISDTTSVQLRGHIERLEQVPMKRGSRLVAKFKDESGELDLIWFRGAKWVAQQLPVGVEVVVFGKPKRYGSKWNVSHPEVERLDAFERRAGQGLQPVYRTTEKLSNRGLSSAGIARLVRSVFADEGLEIPEILPSDLLRELKMMGRAEAFRAVHLAPNAATSDEARRRLKFEELLLLQLLLVERKRAQTKDLEGVRFGEVGDLFNRFYKELLPFSLTDAQKRVMREIRADVGSGWHMNRLLQGDVGSGKTVVALLSALLALDNGYQCCIMAPTEILARQHLLSFSEMLGELGIQVQLLTGSVKGAERRSVLEGLESGTLRVVVGTHALIEDNVKFQRLGLAVIDEQHRFGVQQRSKMWRKSTPPPHVLVMTATPIPRTLAMTAYGDLDVSIIDELPPGRKEVKTVHRTDAARSAVFQFMETEISAGRQVYVVYPLIEESATLDFKDLEDGYDSLTRRFPRPKFQISIVHGRMKPEDKAYEMRRFANGETHILMATTVIEVGVNIPNASVMVIESAERFGLAQLHQLRGRVGRGGDQSYCLLMSGVELGSEARRRMETMVMTSDGFRIAEVDLELRGPGDVMGTQQSGVPDLKMADLLIDREIVSAARYIATRLLEADPTLTASENALLGQERNRARKNRPNWSRIS
jgi:ATP-dependent DNA helicase RecG